MRKLQVYIITSFLLILHQAGYAQQQGLLQKAFSFQGNKQFDAAIDAYKSFVAQDTVTERHSLNYSRIADCYKALGKKEDAKSYYRAAIITGDFNYSYVKRRYAVLLSDFYLSEKKYDSVLYYIKYVNSLHPKRVLCGSNNIEFRTPVYHRMMLAYEGLGKIDSAIECFLPYAFQEWTNGIGTEFCTDHIYEDDYHCQLQDFLRILNKKYEKEYVKKQVLKLVENSFFTIVKDSKNYKRMLEITSGVVFLGEKIILEHWGTGYDPDPQTQARYNKMYKENFSAQVAHSLLYQQFSAVNF